MKTIISLLFIGILVFSSHSQADKILNTSKSEYESFKDITTNYKFTLSNPNLDHEIVKSGTLKEKGESYQIYLPDTRFYCDGDYLWAVLLDDEEITKSDYDKGVESMSLSMFYGLHSESNKSKYEGVVGNEHKITLFFSSDSDFWKAELFVDKKTSVINSATLFGRNGSAYKYEFSNFKTNVGLADAIFTPDLANDYDGYYMNDLTD